MTYGPTVVQRLKDWILFDAIIFPYRKGDVVDAVLRMTVQGQWKADGSSGPKGFLIGLSLFTLSSVMGPSMTGNHDIDGFRAVRTKFIGLNFDQQSKIKKLNRRLLEVVYLNETPKK